MQASAGIFLEKPFSTELNVTCFRKCLEKSLTKGFFNRKFAAIYDFLNRKYIYMYMSRDLRISQHFTDFGYVRLI